MKLLHLITGVEIVGEVEDNGDFYTIKYPIEVKMITNGEDQKPINWVGPFASFVKGHTVHINKSKILFVGEPLASLVEYYEEKVLGKSPLESEDAKAAATFKLTDEQANRLEESAA